jgi:hypothetical protein
LARIEADHRRITKHKPPGETFIFCFEGQTSALSPSASLRVVESDRHARVIEVQVSHAVKASFLVSVCIARMAPPGSAGPLLLAGAVLVSTGNLLILSRRCPCARGH